MSIAVSTFCNENEALTEILNKPGSFHVAIVEVISFADDICHMISLLFFPQIWHAMWIISMLRDSITVQR